MSVAQLLCEGSNNSPDARVLIKLLAGICEIKPLGAKYGMGERIKARREALGRDSIYGILDGDFVKNWERPSNKPKEWKQVGSKIHFGWRWERKEIENYLIDPVVVAHALNDDDFNIDEYNDALHFAKDKIAVYQAARTALSANRIRFKDIPSAFGVKHGKEKHLFPDSFDKNVCLKSIREIIQKHHETQLVSLESINTSFETYMAECINKGQRNKHFLHFFAGKDLLWAMNEWFVDNGLIGALAFREKVLEGIRKTTADVATWLPEWKELRDIINSI